MRSSVNIGIVQAPRSMKSGDKLSVAKSRFVMIHLLSML